MIKVPFSYGLLAAIGIIILLKTPPPLPPSSFPPRVPGATQSIMTGVTPLMVLRFPRVCCLKANVTGLHDWSLTQHCPVVLSLADGLQDCNRLIWHNPHLNLQHQASPCLEQAALKAHSPAMMLGLLGFNWHSGLIVPLLPKNLHPPVLSKVSLKIVNICYVS